MASVAPLGHLPRGERRLLRRCDCQQARCAPTLQIAFEQLQIEGADNILGVDTKHGGQRVKVSAVKASNRACLEYRRCNSYLAIIGNVELPCDNLFRLMSLGHIQSSSGRSPYFKADHFTGGGSARRVLKPDGQFVFNAWDNIEENMFANDVTNALSEFFPHDPLSSTPHGYNDVDLIRQELELTGFGNVAIETREELSRALSPRHPAVAYCRARHCATKSKQGAPIA